MPDILTPDPALILNGHALCLLHPMTHPVSGWELLSAAYLQEPDWLSSTASECLHASKCPANMPWGRCTGHQQCTYCGALLEFVIVGVVSL